MSQYDKMPVIQVPKGAGTACSGWTAICEQLKEEIRSRLEQQERVVLTVDCYPGMLYSELRQELFSPLAPGLLIFTDETVFWSAEAVTARIQSRMTDDRVFGQICLERYEDLLDPEGLAQTKARIQAASGLVVVYGAGARLAAEPDLYVYADLARWEIQRRYRGHEIVNWKHDVPYSDDLMNFKWGYFFEWRVANRHKKRYFDAFDYVLDTNTPGQPRLMSGTAFRAGLVQASSQPFRLAPFFDPGVWGGQWMKKVCGLDPETPNYAWCFDCVPEENSLLLEVEGIVLEIPALDLVLYRPEALLGRKVVARFGAEFPIRFDFLDTMGGQNLSLQVHPTVDYIREHFGMAYTQEESYYILDAKEESEPVVYLGVTTGTRKEEFFQALLEAQAGGESFPAERFANRIPVKKHDHLLIPPGTLHCSGKDTMVLEISATPYIFTFKLWDWGRLGLDGKPRPINLAHGSQVLDFGRDTEWVYENLVNQVRTECEEEGHRSEHTGLHELELIETTRDWFSRPVLHETQESVNVLNLVEGEEAVVESPTGCFAPFVVHYAETFVIPACVGTYTIRPHGPSEGREIGIIKARVRLG